jgi:flagella basal body P-ring formation protein FlgA
MAIRIGAVRVLVVAAFAAMASIARADTVALKSFVRVAPGAAVTLGDVADLAGAEAEAVRGVVVVQNPGEAGSSVPVDLPRVRDALKALPKLNLGRLVFSGGTCTVRVGLPEALPVASSTPSRPAAPAIPQETVKDRVALRIASALSADPSDLNLSFEDRFDLLATPVAGRTVAVQPTGISDKMAMSVRVYEGDTIVAQGVARVGVQVRRDVVVAKTTLARGTQARTDMLEADRQWLPATAQPATVAQAVGAVVRGRVEAGKIVMARDVEAPIIVKKGDLVSVDCVAGTVVVGTTARAKENGCDGQVIEFQALQSKKTFQARINGNGKAVLVIPGEDQKPGEDRSGS